jgi:hypothetical protein
LIEERHVAGLEDLMIGCRRSFAAGELYSAGRAAGAAQLHRRAHRPPPRGAARHNLASREPVGPDTVKV